MTDEKWVHAPTFRFLEMYMIQEDIKALLPQGVFLLDVKEDFHQGVVKCVIDAEKTVDLDLTTSISRTINDSGILDELYQMAWHYMFHRRVWIHHLSTIISIEKILAGLSVLLLIWMVNPIVR